MQNDTVLCKRLRLRNVVNKYLGKIPKLVIYFQLFMKEVMIPETLIHNSKGINT